MMWQANIGDRGLRLWQFVGQGLMLLVLLVAILLMVACGNGVQVDEERPTATGTRVDAPTREESPAQTVAPFRPRSAVLATFTPSPTISVTLTITPEITKTVEATPFIVTPSE